MLGKPGRGQNSASIFLRTGSAKLQLKAASKVSTSSEPTKIVSIAFPTYVSYVNQLTICSMQLILTHCIHKQVCLYVIESSFYCMQAPALRFLSNTWRRTAAVSLHLRPALQNLALSYTRCIFYLRVICYLTYDMLHAIDTNPLELRSPELPARVSIPIAKSYTIRRKSGKMKDCHSSIY
nr:hypothetical protein [Diadegma semiclausum ichnovirus]